MTNLLPSNWDEVDPGELRFILMEVFGGPGQYDDHARNPETFYLPLAREQCCVALTFSDKRVVAVEPGPAFDRSRWELVVAEVDNSSSPIVGRDCSFSGYRVTGSWRGSRSGVQILPPPSDAPAAPVAMAEHPFLLEFPVLPGQQWPVTNFRRIREHRRLSLLLNVLLKGGITTQPRRHRHLWAVPSTGPLTDAVWVQEFYYANFGTAVQDALSPPGPERIEEIAPPLYYAMIGHDGGTLRVPADLDESICCFLQLNKRERDKFSFASFWMDAAARQWTISASASFASLAIAVEALGDRSKQPSVRFRDFIERYAPGASLEDRRREMYALRSDILHGTGLMEFDGDTHFNWAPPEYDERGLLHELWTLAQVAVRNWLRDPAR